MSFYTKENMKLLIGILSEYMFEKYKVQLDGDETRQMLYRLMTQVQEDPKLQTISVQQANIAVLHNAKEILLAQQIRKPNVSNLTRDKMVFGDRNMQTAMIVPEMDPYMKRPTETMVANGIKEGTIDRMILERDRDVGSIDKKTIPDVTQLIRPTKDVPENAHDFTKRLKELESQRTVATPQIDGFVLESSHRDWTSKRYQYKIDLPFVQTSLPLSFYVNTVILPEDTATLAFPYIVLKINNQDIELVHTNLASGGNRSYRTYKPLRKVPLQIVSRNVDVTFARPQGTLLNLHATDANRVLRIEPEGSLLKVITRDYFDKKEFITGDVVYIKDYMIKKSSVHQQNADLRVLNDYLNSPSGHEIIDIGPANENGYYNIFYISAPGSFNKNTGSQQLQSNLITCLQNYNSHTLQPLPDGHIMNLSLQHCINFAIDPRC
jgi:hypothetical protein